MFCAEKALLGSALRGRQRSEWCIFPVSLDNSCLNSGWKAGFHVHQGPFLHLNFNAVIS